MQGRRQTRQSPAGPELLPRCSPPRLLAALRRAERVASTGDRWLHTQEPGPDLSKAGTFLEEGFNPALSSQMASQESFDHSRPASEASFTGLCVVSCG